MTIILFYFIFLVLKKSHTNKVRYLLFICLIYNPLEFPNHAVKLTQNLCSLFLNEEFKSIHVTILTLSLGERQKKKGFVFVFLMEN